MVTFAQENGAPFTIAGDKLPHFNGNSFVRFEDFKLIYSYRQPAEWLAKAAASLQGKLDVRPLLAEYLKGLLLAKSASDCMIVHFDDFLGDNANVVKRVFSFCGFDATAGIALVGNSRSLFRSLPLIAEMVDGARQFAGGAAPQ